MISGIFIDRPRLAFVVSIVITLAGLLAIAAIGGTVPRHRAATGLTTTLYPGADADTVGTVAQPSATVNGVDNAIYYQSASGIAAAT